MKIVNSLIKFLYMDFYYDKFPKIPAGIVERLDGETLFYMPYRSFAHYQLCLDLKDGGQCECRLEDGKIIILSQTNDYGKLRIIKMQ